MRRVHPPSGGSRAGLTRTPHVTDRAAAVAGIRGTHCRARHRPLARRQHRRSRLHHARFRSCRVRMSHCWRSRMAMRSPARSCSTGCCKAQLTPTRGRLTFGFVNLAAYERFDPRQPTASRFVDEDINRLWDPAVLDSAAAVDRARPRTRDPAADRHGGRAVRPALDAVAIGPADPVRHVAEGKAPCPWRRGAGTGRGRSWTCQRTPHDRLSTLCRCGNAVRGEPRGGRTTLAAGDGGHDVRQRCRVAASYGRGGTASGAAAAGAAARSVLPKSRWR